MILFICILPVAGLLAQTPLTVCDIDFKVAPGHTQEFYYGFAEGDQLVFNFQVVKGDEMKEIEVILWWFRADPRQATPLTVARYAYYYGDREQVRRRALLASLRASPWSRLAAALALAAAAFAAR